MKDAILAKLSQTRAALEALNHTGWTRSHTWTPEMKDFAAKVQDNTNETYERCRRVMRIRYGVAV